MASLDIATSGLRPRSVRAHGSAADQIKLFWPRYRRPLWYTCSQSPYFRDLLFSCPAACVEIVSRPEDDTVRQAAMDLVEAGAPLDMIMWELSLPSWFRKLRPDAFMDPMHGRLPPSVFSARFGTRALNLVPTAPFAAGKWLHSLVAAGSALDDEFAFWIGSQRRIFGRSGLRMPITPLALHAWYSRHPELPAARYIETPWSRRMSLAGAAGATRRWLLTILEAECLCGPGCTDEATPEYEVCGYQFMPLVSPARIAEEGALMQHCLAQYVSLAISGLCRLYSIRKDGDRIATLELRASDSSGRPHIHQLKGPRNFTPGQEVLDATVSWLSQHQDSIARRLSSPGERHSNVAFDRILWRPYANALAADATVGKPPTRPAVSRILLQMRDLWSLEK